MKKMINKALIKLLLIIELFTYIFPKSILIANGIYNDKYIPCKNKFIFNIQASLTGILTKNMLDNFTITINNNDTSKALCTFSEEKNYVYNKNILLNCSIIREIYNQYKTFSLSFKGTSKYVDLKNFNENILYIEKTLKNNNIVLMLGDIIEQSCKQNNELYYYNYKIKIENKTIPKILEIYNNDYDLKPNGLDNNKYKNNSITCSIENNNIDNFINCSLAYYKEISNALYYEQKYIYKKQINNYRIYFKNNNENLYIGKNINCKYVNNNIINYIDKLNLRILDDNSNETNPSDNIYDNEETTELIEPVITQNIIEDNIECLSICNKCSLSPSNCTECKKGYYLSGNSCNLCPSGCADCKDNNICNECLNKKFLQYKLNNGKCDLVVENEQNNTENTISKKIKLKYERMDSFKPDADNKKVYFNTHFWLLNYFIYGAKLIITANIKSSSGNTNLLRNLDSKDIDCTQYGDVTTNYLVNFLCSFDSDQPDKIISIEPTEYKIEEENVDIENTQIEEYNVIELKKPSLELEFEDADFNKFLITDITDIKLDKNLTLKLKGSFDNEINSDDEYEIILKKNKNNSEQIKGDCELKKNNKYLSCSFIKNNIKEKETLEIEEGMYKAQQNKDVLIISNLDKKQIKVPNKSISVGAIVGISIAGLVILIPFVIYLVKYLISKKENNENNMNYNMNDIYEGNDLVNINQNRRNRIPNRDNSKDEVLKDDNNTS